MNSDFFSRLINYVIKFNVKKILIIEIDDVSIIEIEQLAKYTEKVCVATEHFFLRRQLTTRFMNNTHIEIFPTHSIKIYDYDAIVCSEIVSIILPIINSISSIKYIFTKSFDMDSVKNFIKFDDIALIKLSEDNRLNNLISKNDEVNEVNEVSKVDEVNEVNETTIVNIPQKTIENIDVNPNDSAKLKCSFFIVNYNTSKLINLLIKSIHKFVKSIDYDIWIFDNSDKEHLILEEPWEDVHILDNTKGQLVDYNKELKKYVEMKYFKNFAGFISLKHALAVQYGLLDTEISDNFILCDSDVLFINDIDFLTNADKITIGSIETKAGDIERLAPYMCYINRSLVNKFGISYFDSLRFHGCKRKNGTTRTGYDTGASFLEDCKTKAGNNLISVINIYNYCIHLGSGSRTDRWARFGNYDLNELIEKYQLGNASLHQNAPMKKVDYSNTVLSQKYAKIKEMFSVKNSKNKIAIYTCITGNYDSLKSQKNYDFEHFDYICFTDIKGLSSDEWNVIDITELKTLLGTNDETRLSRFVKTHPHLFLNKYEKSIWIDGNIEILSKNLMDDYVSILNDDEYFLTSEHPCISHVYDEIDKCRKLKKDSKESLDKIENFLKLEKFFDVSNHVQTNIILRNHNNKKCIFLMEKWWEMIKNYSKRDQTSFNYVFWKYEGKFTAIPWKFVSSHLFNTNYQHLK